MRREAASPLVPAGKRQRRTFAKIPEILEVPNLIALQRDSFKWFLDEGLRETFRDISPIEDFTGNLAVDFGEHEFGDPKYSVEECKEKDMSYQAPLFVDVSFINKETGEVKEQQVFMGDFPLMTDRGTFIINGTERVVVSQLVRSPGVYYSAPTWSKACKRSGLAAPASDTSSVWRKARLWFPLSWSKWSSMSKPSGSNSPRGSRPTASNMAQLIV